MKAIDGREQGYYGLAESPPPVPSAREALLAAAQYVVLRSATTGWSIFTGGKWRDGNGGNFLTDAVMIGEGPEAVAVTAAEAAAICERLAGGTVDMPE